MQVTFLHPRNSISFEADVDHDTTGQTCLEQLGKARFIEPATANRPYALMVQRTRRQLLPHMTMQDGGVQHNDALSILQQEQGATQEHLRNDYSH